MADHPDFEEMVKAVGRWRDPIAYSATVYTPAYDRRWGLERSIREILTAAGVPELLAERDRLREALKRIQDVGFGADDPTLCGTATVAMASIARSSLAENPDGR